MTDPAVLDEPGPLGSDDQIHAEPALLNALDTYDAAEPKGNDLCLLVVRHELASQVCRGMASGQQS